MAGATMIYQDELNRDRFALGGGRTENTLAWLAIS
jgi:hypothetical protein